MMMIKVSACLMAVLLLGMAGTAMPYDTIFKNGFDEAPNQASPLGTNLEEVTDFSAAYAFVDVFKQSRTWITANRATFTFDTDDFACLDLDADGWVRSLTPQLANPGCTAPDYDSVSTLFFFSDDLAGNYPGGRYVVTYDGAGSISYHFAATKNVALSAPGRDVVDVNAANGGFMLRIDATDPGNTGNYIRNIRMFMPGFDETTGPSQLFHPDFLALLTRMKSLRFMDWMRTNDSAQSLFADRPLRTDVRWTEIGVPLEIMVELANRTGTEPWFNMPHRATDDYMTQFATQTRALLRPDLDVYVEFSNEVWNPQFAQGAFVEAQGDMEFGSAGDPFIRRLNWHGKRTAEMCELWKTAFGAEAERVVCVLGAQAANAFTQTEAADCPLVAGPQRCRERGMDAVAIAPYFGNYLDVPNNADETATWTLEQLFAEITAGAVLQDQGSDVNTPCTDNFPPIATHPCPIGAIAETGPWVTAHKSAANARSLALVAYEGGQHLVGVFGAENNAALTALFGNANRDARMGSAYTTYLNQWRDNGGELFMHFSLSSPYTKFGNWGSVESLLAPATPKRNALEAYITTRPCDWPDCM